MPWRGMIKPKDEREERSSTTGEATISVRREQDSKQKRGCRRSAAFLYGRRAPPAAHRLIIGPRRERDSPSLAVSPLRGESRGGPPRVS